MIWGYPYFYPCETNLNEMGKTAKGKPHLSSIWLRPHCQCFLDEHSNHPTARTTPNTREYNLTIQNTQLYNFIIDIIDYEWLWHPPQLFQKHSLNTFFQSHKISVLGNILPKRPLVATITITTGLSHYPSGPWPFESSGGVPPKHPAGAAEPGRSCKWLQ